METRYTKLQPTSSAEPFTHFETQDNLIEVNETKESKTIPDTFQHKIEQPKIDKNIEDFIIPSAFSKIDPKILPREIVKAFNHESKEGAQDIIVEPSVFRTSDRIDPDQFYIAHKNKVPKIEIGNGKRLNIAYNFSPFNQIEKIGDGIVKQTAPVFGDFGSYVLNVPPNHYAKAWSGNKPVLYGEGTHVIHDPLFRFEKKDGDVAQSFRAEHHFVNQANTYIQHGNFHIIRVFPGKFAKIVLDGKPLLLPPQAENKPYFFESPYFQFDPNQNIIDQSANYIEHGNFHQLRVPPGKIAKVVINNIPQLLYPNKNNSPYIINTPIFRFNPGTDLINETENYIRHENIHMIRVPPGKFAKIIVDNVPKLLPPTEDNQSHTFYTTNFYFDPKTDFVDQNTPYIKHGIRHILRLPKGSVAKAWFGNTPQLLERSNDEQELKVLDFEDPQFKLEETKRNGQSYLFLSASEKYIEHGSIKRVIPPIGELAVINKNGTLEVVQGRYDTDSATESVVGFFDTSVQTLEFPSKKTREKRIVENHEAKTNDRVIYDVYTTSDSVEVGLKILVAYRIPDIASAKKALLQFKNMENIADHIEGVVRSDMTKIIKQFTSQKFSAPIEPIDNYKNFELKNQDQSREPLPFAPSAPSAPPPPKTYLEQAMEELKKDLAPYGITLIRMTIEESKILDGDLTKKMSEQALTTAKTNAELAVVEQKNIIAKAQAELKKDVAIIEQSQVNDGRIKAAKALLEAADFEAQARERKAAADAKAIESTAEAEAKAIQLKGAAQNAVLQQQAKFYEDNPRLFELEITKAKFEALKGMHFTVTSKEFSNLFNIPGLSLFNSAQTQQKLVSIKDVPEEKAVPMI